MDEDEDDDHEDDEAWTPSVCPRQGLRPRSAGSGQQANGFVRRSGRRIQHDSLGDIPLDGKINLEIVFWYSKELTRYGTHFTMLRFC